MKQRHFSTSRILGTLKQADVFKVAMREAGGEAIAALRGVQTSSRGREYGCTPGLCDISHLQDQLSPLEP